jgi:hypothetical protein
MGNNNFVLLCIATTSIYNSLYLEIMNIFRFIKYIFIIINTPSIKKNDSKKKKFLERERSNGVGDKKLCGLLENFSII